MNISPSLSPRISKRAQQLSLKILNVPPISYQEYKQLTPLAQRAIVAKNRIINTDTYNRTMGELARIEARTTTKPSTPHFTSKVVPCSETYTLQLRRGQFGYLIACGVEDLAQELASIRISKSELNFAREYYKHRQVPFFNEKLWRWIIESNGGRLPFNIRGVRDGTLMKPGEPFLTVTGPGELIAHFEHLFHRIFYPTLVATRARAIISIIKDPNRFIEVGKRGAITEEQHLIALKAMYVGGGMTMTSNDAGVDIYSLKDVGTIGHRYVQRFNSEAVAFRSAIEHLPMVVLLVDLIDTYKGIDLALKLKTEFKETDKKIFIRLDSGNILDQTLYYLRKAFKNGFTDPQRDKIIVEGIDSLEEIEEIEQAIIKKFGIHALPLVTYGAGGLLISQNTSRSDASTGFKLSEFTDLTGTITPTMKFSNSKGKISYPGKPEVGCIGSQRIIIQEAELSSSLFVDLYANGRYVAPRETLEAALKRSNYTYQKFQRSRDRKGNTSSTAQLSSKSRQLIEQVTSKYGLTEYSLVA